MDEDSGSGEAGGGAPPAPSGLPEVELYAYLLVLVFAIDQGAIDAVRGWFEGSLLRLGCLN